MLETISTDDLIRQDLIEKIQSFHDNIQIPFLQFIFKINIYHVKGASNLFFLIKMVNLKMFGDFVFVFILELPVSFPILICNIHGKTANVIYIDKS